MKEIKNLFDWSKIKKEDFRKRGIYKITNKINGNFYIGSTYRTFKARFHEHQNSLLRKLENGGAFDTPYLSHAFMKYGFKNFELEIIEIIDSDDRQFILDRETWYINSLKPSYNICQDPTHGGAPNKNRKLSDEWKQKIAVKSSLYKHSKESLAIVTQNNKENACKITLTKDDQVLHFNSWLEIANFFNLKSTNCSHIRKLMKNNKPYCGWLITQETTQKKKIKVIFDNNTIIFNSFNECDRYLNMWRGYTSTMVTRKITLLKDKYRYEII